MGYKQKAGILLAIIALLLVAYFSLTPKITGFAGFITGTEASLAIWDETDNASFPYAGLVKYPNDQVLFFANYTNATSGRIITPIRSQCSINFSTSPTMYDMIFNYTKKIWELNSTFLSANPAYNFSANCSAVTTQYSWTNTTPSIIPKGFFAGSMAFDSSRNKTVYFGGSPDAVNTVNETWEYDGTSWTNVTTNGPSPRALANMVYDSNRNVIILFGGSDLANSFDETWEYNGSSATWTNISPATSPLARAAAGFAFVSSKNVAVLAEGSGCNGWCDDVWIYNTTTKDWLNVTPATVPYGRGFLGMVYDAYRDMVLIYGGVGASGTTNDTWELTPADWTFNKVSEGKYRLAALGMVYDSHRKKAVIFGGHTNNGTADFASNYTAEYDPLAQQWTDLNLNTAFRPTVPYTSEAFDSSRNVAVMQGGVDNALVPSQIYNETYELSYSETGIVNSNIGLTDNFTITADTIPPQISITSPMNSSIFYSQNISLQYNAADIHLDKCWYEFSNSSMYDLPNCTNTTILLPQGNYALRIRANDTFGNTNSTPFTNFKIWTQFVTVCSSGCNFTDINDALTFINGTVSTVMVNQSGNYVLNQSYTLTGTFGIELDSWFLGHTRVPIAIFMGAGPATLNCNFNTITGSNDLSAGIAVGSTADNISIENCTIQGMAGVGLAMNKHGIIKQNTVINPPSINLSSNIPSAAVGIVLFNSTGSRVINNTVINATSGFAFGSNAATSSVFENNYAENCYNGIGFSTTGMGPADTDFDNLTLRNNYGKNGCVLLGFALDNAYFENNRIQNASGNGLESLGFPSAGVLFTNTLIYVVGNTTRMNVTGGFVNESDFGVVYIGVQKGAVRNSVLKARNVSLHIEVSSDLIIENNTLFGAQGGIIMNSSS